MLSIGAGNQGEYYLNLATEDYYFEGGEPPGIWSGQGAANLRIQGTVERKQLRHLLAGYSADGKRKLVQNAGLEKRQPGWDLTFSAPKSVSTLWSQVDGEKRHAIQRAHEEAVKAALLYLEDVAAVTRRGQGGQVEENAGLIIARFEHGTSRALEPQLHTHCLVLNVCTRADGGTGTIVSKTLYQHKMAAGAIYRAELAYQCELLGMETERVHSWFEVKGVAESLTSIFSTRRNDLLEVLAASGHESAAAAAIAALASRTSKETQSRSELFPEWRKTGQPHMPDLALQKVFEQAPIRNRSVEVTQAFDDAIESITRQHSHFTERELIQRVAEEAQGRGIGVSLVRAHTEHQLTRSDEIVCVDRIEGETRYSTHEIIELERSLLASVEAGRNDQRHGITSKRVEAVLKRYEIASKEQIAAVRHITEEPGSVKCVRGMAGTGKTFMLQMAREAWERGGFCVLGAALAGKAAEGLQEGSGIASATIALRLIQIDNGAQLNSKTVLVVDEAGMVGTKQMAELYAHLEAAGAKLVLVGDERQLQAIEAGGVFKSICDRVGSVELADIRRQKQEWQKQVVRDFAAGNAERALTTLAAAGCVTVADDHDSARRDLVNDWKQLGDESPEKTLIFVGTNKDAATINRMCQSVRRESGQLGTSNAEIGGCTIWKGDRVLFTKNSYRYDVRNGQIGTVTGVYTYGLQKEEKSLVVRLDGGRTVSFPLADFKNIKLGYAVTTHKGQGATVDYAFILCGGSMQDREISLVQASRAIHETRVYTDRFEAGEDLQGLAKQMSRSRIKTLASDLMEQDQEKVQQQQTLTIKLRTV